MEEENNPRTTRDALTYELLGDIGQLHDQIKGLPASLKEALAPTLGAMAIAAAKFQEAINRQSRELADERISFKEKMAVLVVVIGLVVFFSVFLGGLLAIKFI